MDPWLGFHICLCLTAIGDAVTVTLSTGGNFGLSLSTSIKWIVTEICSVFQTGALQIDSYTNVRQLIVYNLPFSKLVIKATETMTSEPEVTTVAERKISPLLYCGRKNGERTPSSGRIVNGEEAKIGEFPWVARILVKPGFHLCGGSLIADRYVLSAGHCFTVFMDKSEFFRLPRMLRGDVANYKGSIKALQLVVRFGAVAMPEPGSRVEKQVLEIILHPYYDTFLAHDYLLQTNDIALLRIKPVQFSLFVSPICLPYQNVAGYGALNDPSVQTNKSLLEADKNKMPTTLMKTTVKKISWDKCRKNPNIGKFLDPIFNMTDWHILCLIGDDTDSCQGDSGGGVYRQTPEGNNVIHGIVSWGIGCNRPNYPAAYTRVASFVDFIYAVTKDGNFLPMYQESVELAQ